MREGKAASTTATMSAMSSQPVRVRAPRPAPPSGLARPRRREPRFIRLGLALGLWLALVVPISLGFARDRGADGRFDERRSSHFRLFQDVDIDQRGGANGSRRFERDVLQVLEGAYDRVSREMGLRPRSDIDVFVYDPSVFDTQFSALFGFRAAGFFDGGIHIRGATRVDQRMVRTLNHEYVHAAIVSAAGPGHFPAWLNEGLAEYFENVALGKRQLSPGESRVLGAAVRGGHWIPLPRLSTVSFSHLDEGSAGLAYLQSYAIVTYLARSRGDAELERFCDRFIRTGNLERSLKKVYRLGLGELEQAVQAAL